jgi:hypothetical protein
MKLTETRQLVKLVKLEGMSPNGHHYEWPASIKPGMVIDVPPRDAKDLLDRNMAVKPKSK